MGKTHTITRKITLYPQGDTKEVNRVYAYLRNGMRMQSKMMNQCMSAIYIAKKNNIEDKEFNELMKTYGRVPSSERGSAYDFDMKDYPVGLPIAGSIPHICLQKFKAYGKDIMDGKVSLPTFKITTPLLVTKPYVDILGSHPLRRKINDVSTIVGYRPNGLYHDYETPMDLYEGLKNDNKPGLHIKFVNNIVFDVVFGNPHKSQELRSVFQKIFEGEYKVCDSSIGLDKRKGKKIILYLSLKAPVCVDKKDESVVVGVDLGVAIPAMCALNNNKYDRLAVGSYNDFTRKRKQLQAQRKRIQKALKTTTGGHGRKKKLAHLEKLRIHERDWARTFNHMVSRRVVEYAEKNHAKYINLENLTGIAQEEKGDFLLRNWSRYELQEMIRSKATAKGIKVRFINPAYTSQTCSICGKRGLRPKQAVFICSDPDCKSHKIYDKGFNADFNAARNIAMSVNFVDVEEDSEEESA